MANVILYADGFEDSSGNDTHITNCTVSANSEASGFEDDNILDLSKRTLWKTGASPPDPTQITFTFANSKTCDFVAFIGMTNFSTWDDIAIQYGSWTEVTTYSANPESLADGTHVVTFDSASSATWRLNMSDVSPVQSSVQAILFGQKRQFNIDGSTTGNPRKFDYKKAFRKTIVHESLNGNVKAFQVGQVQDFRRSWNYLFDFSTSEQFDSLFLDTRGRLYPFCFQDHDGNIQFGRFANEGLEYEKSGATYKYKQIEIVEEF